MKVLIHSKCSPCSWISCGFNLFLTGVQYLLYFFKLQKILIKSFIIDKMLENWSAILSNVIQSMKHQNSPHILSLFSITCHKNIRGFYVTFWRKFAIWRGRGTIVLNIFIYFLMSNTACLTSILTWFLEVFLRSYKCLSNIFFEK